MEEKLWEPSVVGTSGGALESQFRDLDLPMTVLRRRASPGLGRALKLWQIVGGGSFDVVHANLWQANAHARMACVGHKNRPAVVISERNVESSRSSAKRLVDRFLTRWTDAIVGNSPGVMDFIAANHPENGVEKVLIQNAVDRTVFAPGPTPELALRTSSFVVGGAGRLDPEKGFDVLIDAGRTLLERNIDVCIRIVGDGPLRSELESYAASLPVEFVGLRHTGQDMADFYRSLDVFVLSSTHREGRANVLLEAIACGVPVVSTDVPGAREVMGFAGPVVDPCSHLALADAIERLLQDPASARRRSTARAAELPSFGDLARAYHRVFERVAR